MDINSGLTLRRDAVRAGHVDSELHKAKRRGLVRPVRRGAVAGASRWDDMDATQRHRLLVEATVAAHARLVVVSHVSAAVLHGLDVWGVGLARAHITIDSPSGGRVGAARHLHTAPLDACDVVDVHGITATTVARTVVDCACREPFDQAVAIGDCALRLRKVTHAELNDALDRARSRQGVRAAAQVLAFLDGRSESVGESRSRVAIARLRFAPPQLQHGFHRRDGSLIGRVDFYFEESGVIGEFDGMGKYAGDDAAEVLQAEKKREDELRATTGAGIARWYWEHLDTPNEIAARLHRAMTLARRPPRR